MGCDTLVALAPATRDGRTIFAKNSDRHPRESQGVVQEPRRRHWLPGPLPRRPFRNRRNPGPRWHRDRNTCCG